MVLAVIALAALLATLQVNAFFVNISPLLSARMDPIVNPGVVGGHTHQIYGANNFRSVLNTPTELLNADCTTAEVTVDKSNYWVPLVYFINDNGKYEPLQSNGGRAYYRHDQKSQPYPQGFRMLAGSAQNRDLFLPELSALALGYRCDKVSSGAYLPNATTFPNSCTGVWQTIIFPSCGWANQTLDTPNHQDHVAYPVAQGGYKVWWNGFQGMKCPPSHPIHYSNIHLEIYYELSGRQQTMWKNKSRANRLILSSGDLVGTSGHGDFVMGWEPETFKQAVAQCGDTNAVDCPVLNKFAQAHARHNCRFAGMLPDEELGYTRALDKLPGCNPVWNLAAGDHKPACDASKIPVPGWTPPNAVFRIKNNYAIPIAADFGNTPIRQFPATQYGDTSYFEPYDQQTYCCNQKAPNLGKWFNGTAADIKNNKVLGTAVNKIDKVYKQKDTSRYSNTKGPNPPTKVYATHDSLYNNAYTHGIAGSWITPPPNWTGYAKKTAAGAAKVMVTGLGSEIPVLNNFNAEDPDAAPTAAASTTDAPASEATPSSGDVAAPTPASGGSDSGAVQCKRNRRRHARRE